MISLLLTASLLAQTPSAPKAWKDIDALVSKEQKLQEAATAVEARLALARRGTDDVELARALIRLTQLRIALGGYETAVKQLKGERWPEAALPRTAVELYYAQALTTYVQAYSWEIRQRERVESKGEVDLKGWTAEQLHAEAFKAYDAVWARRAQLGAEKVAALAEYLAPGSFPAGVRDTLRDAATYLTVQALEDTQAWSPEEQNGLYRLDVAALAKGEAGARPALTPSQAAAHPLERAVALLDDLEAWHAKGGRREAALEARGQRLLVLYERHSDVAPRAVVQGALESRLQRDAGLPWSAFWTGALAEWVLATGDAVRARGLAQAAARAHAGSVGAQRCQALVARIEAPEVNVTAMQADGLERRSLDVSAKNVDRLYFKAWRFDFKGKLEQSINAYAIGPSEEDIGRAMAGGKAPYSWSVALAPTPDFQAHRTPVIPPIKEKGAWIIVSSVREDFSPRANRLQASLFFRSDLVLSTRMVPQEGATEATVFDGESGAPLAGVEVELWQLAYGRKAQKVKVSISGPDGLARFQRSSDDRGGNWILLARRGEELAYEGSGVNFYRYQSSKVSTALIFTDRSTYRPQQKVLWKVIAYDGNAERTAFKTVPGAELTVELMDGNWQKVDTKTVRTNSFGTAAGEFLIPAGRPLGMWRVNARGGTAGIRVEEYKRPTFEVTFKDDGAPLRLNAPAKLTGEARYLFGLPVAGGEVKWRVTRRAQAPWWWGWYGWAAPSAQPQVIANGSSAVKPDGTFEVPFTPAADPAQSRELTYLYEVSADLTDEGGETRSASKSRRLGFVSVEARLDKAQGFFTAGQPVKLSLRRSDLDGNPRAGKGSWKVVPLQGPARTVLPAEEKVLTPRPVAGAAPPLQSPGDLLRLRSAPGYQAEATVRSWPEGPVRAQGEVLANADGVGELVLGALPAGAFRVLYETADEAGNLAKASLDVLVTGSAFALPLPLASVPARTLLRVGERFELLLGSGLPNQALVVEVFRAGKRLERRVLSSTSQGALYTRSVTPEDRGGFTVTVTAVRDFVPMVATHDVFVPYDDKELQLEFSTFRDSLKPGAKETFRVTVKGERGKVPVAAAEVLTYMFDRSLDLFGPHAPPRVAALYPWRTGAPYPQWTLGAAQQLWLNSSWYSLPSFNMPSVERLKFEDAYGVGGLGLRGRGYGGGGLERKSMRSFGDAADALAGAPLSIEAAPKGGVRAEAMISNKDKDSAPAPPPPAEPPGRGPAQAAEGAATPLRSDFSETAYFLPQLVTGPDGAVAFEFTVPDSVTGWQVWAHAITRDLRGGSVERSTRSVKELMVRPYVPRFLREGDQASLKVAVNNAGPVDLVGELQLDVVDPESGKSVAGDFGLRSTAPQPFSVKKGEGTTVTYALTAPKRVGQVALKVIAKAGNLSDGELRALPLLPSRMHLAQSKFVTLRDASSRTMSFDDLKANGDPTRINEQLVVTVDAQLFFTVLQALPYLQQYPYECAEQTLNRFVSSGIVSSVFRDHPAVKRMAEQFSKRTTPLETFDGADPNRKLALEETPWLLDAKGIVDPAGGTQFLNVLDPKVAAAETASALNKLRKLQLPGGAFPWFPGGPPSPFITLYLLHGFSKAAEFKVEVPKDLVMRAWQYLDGELNRDSLRCMREGGGCWEFVTTLNYVASNFPDASWLGGALTDAERKQMLDYSFSHWKQHSPYLKGYLALTLKRMGRPEDAKRVFDSVMDSSKTTQDEGTFWQPEDRSWLWYNDTIETHAFGLRTMTELSPKDPRRDGLVQWLLLNKKLNQWKSTRATAEVLYALVKYLQAEGQLGIREESTVTVGPITKRYEFLPDVYSGKKNQLLIPGPQVTPAMATVTVSKATKGFQFASATWHFSTDQLPKEARGDLLAVSRTYFKRVKGPKETTLQPLAEGAKLSPGDELEVQLSIRAKAPVEYIHLKDPRGAGFEPEGAVSRFKWNLGVGWYEEYRDSSTNFFFERLPAGELTFKYRVRANMGGTFRVGPATLQSMYAPEFTGYSTGQVLDVATGGQ